MRKKAYKSIIKLMSKNMRMDQAYLYFNIYFMISVYFGLGIIELNEK